jgi:hypothetical protein
VISTASGVGQCVDQMLLAGHHTEANVQEGAAAQYDSLVLEGAAALGAAALFEIDVQQRAAAQYEDVAQFESLVLHMKGALVVERQDVLERADIVASQSM